jgi:hypothetical protein
VAHDVRDGPGDREQDHAGDGDDGPAAIAGALGQGDDARRGEQEGEREAGQVQVRRRGRHLGARAQALGAGQVQDAHRGPEGAAQGGGQAEAAAGGGREVRVHGEHAAGPARRCRRTSRFTAYDRG